jgi:small subunit ribosomal protein S1
MKTQQAVLDPSHFMFDFGEPEIDMENHPMALLLEEFEDSYMKTPVMGDIRQGTIVDKRSGEWLVDIGFKSEGIVSSRDLDRLGDEFNGLRVGDEVPVYVMREDKDGNLMLSISKAKAEEDWILAEKLLENQDTDEGVISGYNRGGVIIKIGQVRGFVPASQLSSESQSMQRTDIDPEERWSKLVGTALRFKVIDMDRRRNRLILSERLAMREWRQAQKEKLLESLKEGGSAEGTVSSLADFGAFVNLGGADGLIHLSELSWGRVNHPSEVIQIGQKVKVQILSVDLERKRIGLSLRRMQPEPWETVADKYEVGQVVRGTITKLVNFGAFARLDDDAVEGLIHISELADRRIAHPKEVVAEGDEFDLRIIRIDIERRRMGLSLKQALPEPEENEFDWEIVPLDENPEASSEDENEAVAEMDEQAVPEFA